MPETTDCPHCGRDLTYQANGTTYSRAVMMEIRGVYDGGLLFKDPECGWAWHRWPEGDRLHDVAVPFVNQVNRKVLQKEQNAT